MITADILTAINGQGWEGTKSPVLVLSLVNAWLAKNDVPYYDPIPEEVAQAGALIAQAIQDGTVFAGRTEAKVVSKSVKAGDVATSKTYATGVDVDPISAEEQQALMLISSYRIAPSPIQQLSVIRG